MNNYREVELLPIKSVGASGTETIDINVDEPVTSLDVYFRATNGAAVADTVPPEGCIDKIEIVDGGKVYWSTSGPQAVAAAVYETGKWPAGNNDERANNGQYILIPLLFGRYIGDEEFAFSPTKLLNPQIKVTWTRNALHTAAGYTLGIRVKTMQGVTSASRALMVKSVRSWTSAGAGIDGTDLPVDLDIRKLYIGLWKTMRLWSEMLTHLKMDCDVGKLIMFDITSARFVDMMKDFFPPVGHHATICMDDGVWKESFLGNLLGTAVNSGSPGYFANAWSAFASRYQQWSQTDAGVAAADVASTLYVEGYLPWTVLCYPFGRQQEPDTWFKASRYGQVKLELTQGEAAVPFSILLQCPTPLP